MTQDANGDVLAPSTVRQFEVIHVCPECGGDGEKYCELADRMRPCRACEGSGNDHGEPYDY
jgi:DnaJ-class molecular chaperone